MILSFFSCLVFGVVAGLLAGMFGIGGGLVLVPFFLWLFTLRGFAENYVMVIAVATSLATIIFTSVASVIAHHRLKTLMWGAVLRLIPGILIGSVLGAVIADYISAESLRTIFAFFLFYVGLQMVFQITPESGHSAISSLFFGFAGVVIGILSAILGIGGGTLTVPFLLKNGFRMRNAVAVSSACGLPIAVAGTISYALLGWHKMDSQAGFLGYVYLPAFVGIICTSILAAPLGARWGSKFPAKKMKRYFSIVIFLGAFKLLS